MTTYRTLILAPLLASAALALPVVASATTFCVNVPDCPAPPQGVSTGGDLQAALDDAAAAGGANTVLVGDPGSPYMGPFNYQGESGGGVTNPVTVLADGPGRPLLTASDLSQPVLTVANGTLAGIDVALPSSAQGIGVQLQDSSLRDVTVSGPAGNAPDTAVSAQGQSSLDNVSVTASADVGVAVQGSATQEASVSAQNLRVSGSPTAASVDAVSRFIATQSQFTAPATGLFTQGSTELDRVTVATTNPDSAGVFQAGGALGLLHVTVAHEAPQSGNDRALSLHTVFGANASLGMLACALAGYTHGIVRSALLGSGGTFSFGSEQSVWNSAADQLGDASLGPVHEVGDVHVEAALVDLAGGDLRPRGSSAQIDLDTVTDPSTYHDLVGTPAIDGKGDGVARPESGALEYRGQEPSIDALTTPAAGSAGGTLAFDTAVSDADGDHLQVRWDFGDGTTATGTTASHAYVAPGSYQGTLTATNETGLSAQRAFTITITPAPLGTPVTPGTPGVTVHVSSHITSPHGKVKARRLHTITGTATATLGLSRVRVAIVRPTHRTGKLICRQLGRDGKLHGVKPSGHTCRPTLFLNASGTARWTLRLKRQLPNGKYVAISEASDTAGHSEPIGNGDVASFQLT
jgi:PKD domain-containing protein